MWDANIVVINNIGLFLGHHIFPTAKMINFYLNSVYKKLIDQWASRIEFNTVYGKISMSIYEGLAIIALNWNIL